MGDVDGRDAHLPLDALDHVAHFHAQLGIQIGKGLVHQQHLGLNDDSAGQRHALLLSAGKLRRHPVGIIVDLHQLENFIRPLVALGLRHVAGFETVGHIIPDAHVRKYGVILEHHAHVAAIGGDLVDDLAVHADLAALDGVKADNHPEKGGFAAAGGAQQGKKLARLDLRRKALNHNIRAVGFGYIVNLNGDAHLYLPRFKNREASRLPGRVSKKWRCRRHCCHSIVAEDYCRSPRSFRDTPAGR